MPISFEGDENVLELEEVAAQRRECTPCLCVVNFKTVKVVNVIGVLPH